MLRQVMTRYAPGRGRNMHTLWVHTFLLPGFVAQLIRRARSQTLRAADQVVQAVAFKRQRLEFEGCAALTQREGGETLAVAEAYCTLAEACTAFDPAQRPTASDVVFRLQRLLDQSQGDSDQPAHSAEPESQRS